MTLPDGKGGKAGRIMSKSQHRNLTGGRRRVSTSETVVHAGEFGCPKCKGDDSERRRSGDWVRFRCIGCGHKWSRQYKHVAGVRHVCSLCGEPALKTPLADYQSEDGGVWHVSWFVGRMLCWRHGYQRGGGPAA
jgi:ribosomal protein L37AE/L43A